MLSTVVATLHVRETLGVSSVTAASAWQPKCRNAVSDVGSFTLTARNPDTAISAAPTGRIVRMHLDTQPVFQGIIERKERQSVAQTEEVDQVTAISGRGIGALMEEALVYPVGGTTALPTSDSVPFDSSHPDYDISGWASAYEVAKVADIQPGTASPWGLPFATDMADKATVNVIGPSGETPATSEPAGYYYFAKDEDYGIGGAFRHDVDWDNEGELRLDTSVLVANVNGFERVHRSDASQSGGTRRLWAKVLNGPPSAPGPVALALRIAALDQSGGESGLYDYTDASWKIWTDVTTTPGFTPGRIMLLLIAEAQARGCLADLTVTFTELVDSAGNAWAETADVVLQVGLDYLSVLNQLAESLVDWSFSPTGFQLNMWAKDGMGAPSGVTLGAGVNVTSLKHTTEG